MAPQTGYRKSAFNFRESMLSEAEIELVPATGHKRWFRQQILKWINFEFRFPTMRYGYVCRRKNAKICFSRVYYTRGGDVKNTRLWCPPPQKIFIYGARPTYGSKLLASPLKTRSGRYGRWGDARYSRPLFGRDITSFNVSTSQQNTLYPSNSSFPVRKCRALARLCLVKFRGVHAWYRRRVY